MSALQQKPLHGRRSPLALRTAFAASILSVAASGASLPQAPDRQILWQRSLDDALALASAEGRPLFIAVNMDGESASERIVRGRYRDPAFVAWTRPFVCVVASAFRHAARDHDEQGRRIPCPRLGEVTCGEHIALEPILFDRYLGGVRIAPRHAVILADGTKSFDLYELFDLRDLDHKLAEASKFAPRFKEAAKPQGTWPVLAGARDHLGRSALEATLFASTGEMPCAAALDAIAARGDAGSVDALRLLIARVPPPSSGLLGRITRVSRQLHIEAPVAAAIREHLAGLGAWPGAPGLGADGPLLGLLGNLDGSGAASRSLLLAYAALGQIPDSTLALETLAVRIASKDSAEVAAAIRDFGLRPDVGAWWTASRASAATPTPARAPEEKRSAEAIEAELSQLDQDLDAHPDDPDLLARYGRNSLELAERRLEAGSPGAQPLLQDADHFLDKAWQVGKRDSKLLFDRAKTAYLAGDFAEEERIALTAEAGVSPEDRIEAERWVGDATARLLAARSGGAARIEIEGILRGGRALAEVAASPAANETDWISLGSFLGALGMRREELAVLQLGAERLPDSAALRAALNEALRGGGRIDLVPAKAEWIARKLPESSEAAWFAGHARLLAGEERRRCEDPDGAIEAYRQGDVWFLRSADLRPDFRENTDHYRALCALGRGFAHLLADRRPDAAKCLVEGISIRPQVAATRDGLDREPIDLLDGALEWRESGPSPVDVHGLLDSFERAVRGDATWVLAISDSELREALRADGRGEIVEGDRYLSAAIDAARRGVAISDDETSRRALAQPLTVSAERLVGRGDVEGARKPVLEAATLLGMDVPAEDADAAALQALLGKLRESLGEARPRFRPGR